MRPSPVESDVSDEQMQVQNRARLTVDDDIFPNEQTVTQYINGLHLTKSKS